MPKVSVNNDPLLERAIFAFDGTNYRVVSVDTSGQLVAALATGSTIEVTQDNAANLLATVNLATDQNVQARAHGYDGSNWRKLQQLWGYTGRWIEQKSNLSAAAGANTLTSTAVPSGYVYVLQNISIQDVNNAMTRTLIYLTLNGTLTFLDDSGALAANTQRCWKGESALAAGDTVSVQYQGCTLNDDIYLNVSGYTMKIND